MGLSGLDQALSGIRVAQQQLSVLSNNISNAQVEGFTRKILPQSTLILNGEGAGVLSETIIRKVDSNLQLDLFRQTSVESFLTTRVDSLDRIQQFHGPPDGEASFSALLGDLRDSFAALDNDPGDPLLINETLSSAERFANRIQEFSELVQELRNDAESDISSAVTRSNQLLEQISDLNSQIKFNNAVNNSTAQLEDQRDQAILELSEFIEITSFTRGDGVLVVQSANGQKLADENATEIFFQQSNIGPDSFYPSSINGIFVGGDPETNPNAVDITTEPPGGSIGALIELRDDTLPVFQAQVDELAANVADRFDRQGLRLFTNEAGNLPDFSTNPDDTPDITYNVTLPSNNIFADVPALGVPGVTSNQLNINITIPGGGTETLTIDLGALDGDGFINGIPATDTPDAAGIAFLINQQITLNPNISGEDFTVTGNGTNFQIVSEFAFSLDGASTANPLPAGPPSTLNTLGFGDADDDNEVAQVLPFTGANSTVDYVGFAREFQVNPAVVDNPNLLQSGTIAREDGDIQPGSNEVIRRILEFTFGETEFQQATTTDFGVDAVTGVDNRIQDQLSLFADNRIEGSVDLEVIGNLFTSPDSPLDDPAAGPQEIAINFTDPTSGITVNVVVDLSDLDNDGFINGVAAPGLDSPNLDGLINLINQRLDEEITAQIGPALPPGPRQTDEGRGITATKSGGSLVIEANFDVTISTVDPGLTNPASPTTLGFLGLEADSDNQEIFQATQPFFDVAVGDNELTRVIIDEDDTITDLQDKLQLDTGVDLNGGVPDLVAEIVSDPGDPLAIGDESFSLRIRPGQITTGIDANRDGLDDTVGFGGDIKLVGGPFETTAGNPILEAVFGAEDPVENIAHRAFRVDNLGAEVDLNTGIDGVETLLTYSQNVINTQTSESIFASSSLEDEAIFRETLLQQFQNESGVNIDEELANLILVQTAFSAAARAVSAIDELFEDLLNAVA